MKNLQFTVSVLVATQVSQESNVPICSGGIEHDKYTDGGTYITRVEVGCE